MIIVYHKMNNFSTISWREQGTFLDRMIMMMMMSTLYYTNILSWIFIVLHCISLKQQFTDRHATFNSDTFPTLKVSLLTNTPPMRFCAQMNIYSSGIYTLLCVNLFSVITELIEPKFLFG